MLHDFAQELHASREPVVRRWIAAVRADPKLITANRLEEIELRDHLGALVYRLAETLAEQPNTKAAENLDRLASGSHQDASAHGHTRWVQQYRVDELVREIAVLRTEMLEIFSEFLRKRHQIKTEEFLQTTQIVHRFFDEICMSSVATYVEDREQAAESTQEGLRMLNQAMERQHNTAAASRRRILSTVVHEMATPVNALGLGVTYLAESQNPGERKEAGQLIGRTLEHLRTMLDQLLDFARADGDSEKLRVGKFEVRPLFEYLVSGFEPLALSNQLTLRAELDETLLTVCSDENKVQRIAVNLLSNAVKYTDKGEVSLTIKAVSSSQWLLEVADTGDGIPEEDLHRIFAEFQRLTVHDGKPGLGLGLAIVRNLTERLGGEVKVKSKLGQGSCFSVLLPREI